MTTKITTIFIRPSRLNIKAHVVSDQNLIEEMFKFALKINTKHIY